MFQKWDLLFSGWRRRPQTYTHTKPGGRPKARVGPANYSEGKVPALAPPRPPSARHGEEAGRRSAGRAGRAGPGRAGLGGRGCLGRAAGRERGRAGPGAGCGWRGSLRGDSPCRAGSSLARSLARTHGSHPGASCSPRPHALTCISLTSHLMAAGAARAAAGRERGPGRTGPGAGTAPSTSSYPGARRPPTATPGWARRQGSEQASSARGELSGGARRARATPGRLTLRGRVQV